MNSTTLKIISSGVFIVMVLACANVGVFAAIHDEPLCVASATTIQQLAAAQRATARFQTTRAAEAAGYVDISLVIPNMGEHWVNPNLVDSVFDPEQPEALVYADIGNGRLELVAVEYLAPYSASGPPEGFAGNCDRWSPFGDPPVFWTLHAWIWQPNISGTFAKFNPIIP